MRYRIILAVFLIIIFIISGILIYINNVFLPVTLKKEITQKLEKNLGKDVRIEKIRYSIFKGLIIKNLAIFDAAQDKTYLEVKEISFNFLITPLLQRKIIIPLLNVESPQIYLTLRQDNTLNIMDVFRRERIGKEKLKFAFFIYKINVSNGKCQFRDELSVPNYVKEITDFKIGAAINLPSQIKFILQAKVISAQPNPAFISASGEYDILKQELQGEAKLINITVNEYPLVLERLPISVSSGIMDADLEINLKNKQMLVKGMVHTKGLQLKKGGFVLSDDIDMEPEARYDFGNKSFKFKSRLGLAHAVFSGLDYFKDISGIQGNIYLEENKIWSDGLKARVLGSPADLKGVVIFSDNQLNWKNVSLNYKQIQCDSSGNLTDFKQPKIDLQLNAKDLSLKTSLNIQDEIINIKDCSGKYLDSDFAVKGKVDNHDKANPLLSLNLDISLNSRDPIELLPVRIRDALKKTKLGGTCKIKGNVSGAAKNIADWDANLKFSSASMSVYDFKLDNMNFSLKQNNRLINIDDFTAKAYSGNIKLQLLMNLTSQTPQYSSKILLSDVDLEKLKMDTKLKDKNISGILNIRADLQGEALKPEALQASGYASIKNGRLWELNLFKGLGEFLFIPVYQKIVFKEADANFVIKNKNIEIGNSFLGSEKLDLACEGKIGFDGSLNLNLNSQINEELVRESPDLRKFTSAVFGNLLVIRVSGTVQKPEYKVVPATKELIKQIKRFFLPR
jgi:hypothetical protein